MLLGRPCKDFDFSFAGGVPSFVQSFPTARKVGRTVDVWLLNSYECRPLQGTTIAEDLLTRDLTINALAMDEQGCIHAHPKAFYDLQHKFLRPASPESFHNDPARVFRLARMAATFPDFSLHDEAIEQMRQISRSVLLSLPAERVCREVSYALSALKPSRFLSTLHTGQCLSPWLQEFVSADGIPAGPIPWHDNSVLAHTGEVMDRVAGDPLAVWMALCHDIGKTLTPPSLWPRHIGHEHSGEALALKLAERLAMPKKYHLAGALACRLHMKAGLYATLRRTTRRDLLWEARGVHRSFWAVVNADSLRPISALADQELAAILAVHLPPHLNNLGPASALHLRQLQCHALVKKIGNVSKPSQKK